MCYIGSGNGCNGLRIFSLISTWIGWAPLVTFVWGLSWGNSQIGWGSPELKASLGQPPGWLTNSWSPLLLWAVTAARATVSKGGWIPGCRWQWNSREEHPGGSILRGLGWSCSAPYDPASEGPDIISIVFH